MNFKIFLFVTLYLCSSLNVSCIRIEKNAYSGISISFSDEIKEQHFSFDKLKQILHKSSEYLYHATRKRAFFQEFIIILPSTWTKDFCTESTDNSPEEVNIYISNSAADLKAQHSKGCGFEGEKIYMPLSWLTGDTEDLARQFVQQWSVYRYGVFEENPLEKDTCYVSPKRDWSPAGCYNVNILTKPDFSKDGLAICNEQNESALRSLKSSLMFKANYSKALDFCDGSLEFPHNPAMPTLHNNLCDGKTVWSVIENSNDFQHGKNLPGEFSLPPSPSFKCFREQALQLSFAIQNSSTDDVTLAVQELRYSLYHYLRNLVPKQARIYLGTFSNTSDTSESVELNLNDDKELFKTLDKYVRTTKKVSDISLLAGIRKALNASQFTSHPSPKAVIIAWESALIGQKISQLLEEIQFNPKVQLHLILIEDTVTDVVPADLVDAVRSTGGSLHSLPNPYHKTVRSTPNVELDKQLNIILSSVLKSSLQLDDKVVVVHEAVYKKSTGIVDTFVTPPLTSGKLVYIMHCDIKDQIGHRDQNCSLWDELSSTFKCGEVIELKNEKARSWTYKFEITTGVNSPVCSSTALLLMSSSSESVSLRGWLNEYVITPGQTSLIIYAEINGILQQRVLQVLAYISGPGADVPIEIELRDNGNGDPDVRAGDGIYSRYFTSYKEKGTYVVTVYVRFNTSEETGISNEAESIDPGIVQRKIIGSFSVTTKPSSVDIIPPNRIADLKVAAIDHENSTVTLQWTAPGDNYDFGKAMKYEIKSASHPANLMEIYFNADETTLLKTLKNPESSGKEEIHKFNFPRINTDATYYVALRAEDTAENKGKISNIVQVFFKKSSTVFPDPHTSSIEMSSITPSPTVENGTNDSNVTFTEETAHSTVTESSSTTAENISDITTGLSWKDIFVDSRFIILVSSFGGILLLLIIINIIICCCYVKKKSNSPKIISRKSSLRPPYNLNITYQKESQSIDQSEYDTVSMTTSADQSNNSSDPSVNRRKANPGYSYHTSKSLLNKSKSQTDSELGFKLVEAMPAYATRSLSRFARRLNDEDVEGEIKSAAQPQQPSNTNETQIYSLGVV